MAKPTTAQKPVLATVPDARVMAALNPTTNNAPKKRGPGRPPGAKAKTKAGKSTQWAKWGKQAARFVTMSKQLDAISAVAGSPLSSLVLISDESITEIGELVAAMQKLDADRAEVPAIPKAPKGPLFALGDNVKVAKRYQSAYLEIGLHEADDLDALVVLAVAKKGILCVVEGDDAGSPQVFVRYSKHLEKR